MNLLILIAYMVHAGGLSPLGKSHSRAGWLGLDNASARVWERPVQTYERRRIDVGESEKIALGEIFRDIENAYSNSNAVTMARAMSSVSNRVDNMQDELYIKLSNGLVGLFNERFLGGGQLHQFSSPAEFEHFARLHMGMALFLGGHHCRRNEYDGRPRWIEYRTFEVLKQYESFFRDDGKNDFAIVARRLLDEWAEHIESDEGFIRRCAYYDVDATRPLIQQGKLTPGEVRFSVFMTVCHVIKCGYTPKWLDEFYNAEGLRLRGMYDAIVGAYTNNQMGAMSRAMARVQNYWGRVNQRAYFDSDWLLEMFFDEYFINNNTPRRFESLSDFSRFLALNTEMAFFLCNYDNGLSRTPIEPGKLKRKTIKMLKAYADQFHHEGRKDLEKIAQKYLGVWTTYNGPIPSLKWLDVRAHVEKQAKEMAADIVVAHAQNLKAMKEMEERRRRKKEQVEDALFVAFDNDGDGLVNAVDPDPLTPGPDAHGTNAEWYNTVCSNIVTAVDGANGVKLTWREGVNTNAYYFVDMVAEKGPAPVYFTGDRNSRLGNPAVVAHAGETNHVPLLIGIAYAVTSSAPISVSLPSNYKKYTVVERFSPRIVRICWPLKFKFVESITNGKRSYTVEVLPYDPGGTFSWGSTPAKDEDWDDKERENKLGNTNPGTRKAEK